MSRALVAPRPDCALCMARLLCCGDSASAQRRYHVAAAAAAATDVTTVLHSAAARRSLAYGSCAARGSVPLSSCLPTPSLLPPAMIRPLSSSSSPSPLQRKEGGESQSRSTSTAARGVRILGKRAREGEAAEAAKVDRRPFIDVVRRAKTLTRPPSFSPPPRPPHRWTTTRLCSPICCTPSPCIPFCSLSGRGGRWRCWEWGVAAWLS